VEPFAAAKWVGVGSELFAPGTDKLSSGFFACAEFRRRSQRRQFRTEYKTVKKRRK